MPHAPGPALWGGPVGRRAWSGRIRPRADWLCRARADPVPGAARCRPARPAHSRGAWEACMPLAPGPALWGGPVGRRAWSGRIRPRADWLCRARAERFPGAARCRPARPAHSRGAWVACMPHAPSPALWGGPAGRRASGPAGGLARTRRYPAAGGLAVWGGRARADWHDFRALRGAGRHVRPTVGVRGWVCMPLAPSPALWGGPAGRRAWSGRIRPRADYPCENLPPRHWFACVLREFRISCLATGTHSIS
jgi:hypothetical protein